MITRKIFSYGARNLFFAFAVILALAFTACDNDPTINPGVPIADPHSVTYTGYDSKGKAYKLVITRGADSPGTDGDYGGGYRDSRLINGPNDVWADSSPAGDRDGFIFKADGTVHAIDDYTNTTPGVWKIYATGTWVTRLPNWLTFTGSGGSIVYRYTVTETTLTLTDMDGDSETFTKTQAAVSGRSAGSPAPAGKAGNKALTGAIKRAVSAGLSSPAANLGRAAYAPQSGDKFTLTIKDMLTGDTEGTSTGTVTDISSDGDRDTLTLENDGKEFTVKIKDLFIEEITGPIPLDDGEEWEAPDPLYPYDPNHKHTYSATWLRDATQHWRECTICKEEYGRANHTFNGNICSVCNYNKTSGGGNWIWTAVADKTVWYIDDGEPRTADIKSIAYGNNKFVAVSNDNGYGIIAYSSNGASWTAAVTDDPIFWPKAIAYGNNRFVVVGGAGKIMYSSNGINWTSVNMNADVIAYGNNRFVALSNGGGANVTKALYSSDGVSWTTVTFDPSILGVPTAIAYGNNRFVAVGFRDSGNVNEQGLMAQIAYSADGSTWTPVAVADSTVWDITLPSSDTDDGVFNKAASYPIAIAYGGGKFVAGSIYGNMAYSSDGITWTAIANSTFPIQYNHIQAIAYGSAGNAGNRFVAGNNYGQMAYSADGINWTAVSNGGLSNGGFGSTDIFGFAYGLSDIFAIAYGGGRFVAVGDGGKMAYANW